MHVYPRPETFLEASANRHDEGTVGVGLEKVLETVDIDRCDNPEEIRVFSDGLHCFVVGKFSLQYCR